VLLQADVCRVTWLPISVGAISFKTSFQAVRIVFAGKVVATHGWRMPISWMWSFCGRWLGRPAAT